MLKEWLSKELLMEDQDNVFDLFKRMKLCRDAERLI